MGSPRNSSSAEAPYPKAIRASQSASRQRLPKKERLFLRDQVETLFSQGKSFVVFPYRVVFLIKAAHAPSGEKLEEHLLPHGAELLISVAKRRLKRAVDRNRCKRITKETYRMRKAPLLSQLEATNLHLSVAFLLVSNDIPTFEEADAAMATSLSKLETKAKKYATHHNGIS